MSQESEGSKSPTATSPESTPTVSGAEPSQSTSVIFSKRDRGPASISSAALEAQLQNEKTERRIERFFWVFSLSIFLEVFLYKYLDSNFAFGLITCLVLAGLTSLANWLEVPWIVRFLEILFHRLSGGVKRPTEKEPDPKE
jgi:hypothetical protein